MAKNIKISRKQLEEALNVYVNPEDGQTADDALDDARDEVSSNVSSSVDVDYVFSESNTFTKAQIKESRKINLNKNSVTLTKKDFK